MQADPFAFASLLAEQILKGEGVGSLADDNYLDRSATTILSG
ncbi:hypothetical protein [Acidovorax sp.]|jgi:hypothetical protein